jgi:hypothetical protein
VTENRTTDTILYSYYGCALALPCDGLSDKIVHTWTILARDYMRVLNIGLNFDSCRAEIAAEISKKKNLRGYEVSHDSQQQYLFVS